VNKLQSIPPEIGKLTNLTHLLLSDNQIDFLAYQLCDLTHLTELHLWRNPLSGVPPDHFLGMLEFHRVDPHASELFQYLRTIKQSGDPVKYQKSRIMIVGDASVLSIQSLSLSHKFQVGKTSLVEVLSTKKSLFVKKRLSTLDYNIATCGIDITTVSISPYTFDCWDFAG